MPLYDFFYADRMRSITTSTGLDALVLAADTGPWVPITYAAIGDKAFYYCIVHENGIEWEVGQATIVSGNYLIRTAAASSDGGAKVDFSAGTKEVFLTLPAAAIARVADLGIGKGSAGPGWKAALTTTDATPTPGLYFPDLIGSLGSPDNGLIEYTICARKSDNSQFKVWKLTVCVEPGMGTYSNKVVTALAEGGAPTWDVDHDSGTYGLLVTGAAATTVNWTAFARVAGYFG